MAMPACNGTLPHQKKDTVIGWQCADLFILYIGLRLRDPAILCCAPFSSLRLLKNPKSAVNFTNSERPFNFAQVNQKPPIWQTGNVCWIANEVLLVKGVIHTAE